LIPAHEPPSVLRHPLGRVAVGGVAVPWTEWRVTDRGHFACSTFSVSLPIQTLAPERDPAWWAVTDAAEIEISAALSDPASSAAPAFTGLILGRADDVEIDLETRLVRLSGRDYAAKFIDARLTGQFRNQTSSEVVTALAQAAGLTADVTATRIPVGRYYQIDHLRLSTGQSPWDLMCRLAREEDFDLWVGGTVVHFHPRNTSDTTNPVLMRWSDPAQPAAAANFFSKPRLRRALTIAKDIVVKVHSWNQHQEKGFTVTYRVKRARSKSDCDGEAQTYTYTRPNLTEAQANLFAQRMAAELSRHEYVIEAEQPADLTLSPRSLIRASGFGGWDGIYGIDQVTRHFTIHGGFVMNWRAKTHVTRETVTT
jgi:hypothetical protein